MKFYSHEVGHSSGWNGKGEEIHEQENGSNDFERIERGAVYENLMYNCVEWSYG